MIRTQVYLPEPLYFELTHMAKRQGVPTAQIIRKTLSDGMKKQRKQTPAQAFAELAKLAIKGPGDLSTNHDDYLYGDAK